MSREIPMLFSAPMVVALLNGSKTETRRLVKPQPIFSGASGDSFEWQGGNKLLKFGYGAPYVHSNWTAVREAVEKCATAQPGDMIWVKETFRIDARDRKIVVYAADTLGKKDNWKWKPSIFMPRKFSRISLLVKEVRCERLQDISTKSATSEGLQSQWGNDSGESPGCLRYFTSADDEHTGHTEPRDAFAVLWDSINKDHPWKTNPWVWVYRFE